MKNSRLIIFSILVSSLYGFSLQTLSEYQNIDVDTIESFIHSFQIPLCLSLTAFGLVQMLMGITVFRVTSFFLGFVVGGLLSQLICGLILHKFVSDSIVLYISIGAIVVMGFFFGIILFKIASAGYIVVTILSGAFIGAYAATILIYLTHTKTPDIYFYIFCPLVGVICSVVQFILPFIRTLLFAILGAYVTVFGIGTIAGNFPNPLLVPSYKEYNGNYPGVWWAYIAAIAIMSGIGFVAQACSAIYFRTLGDIETDETKQPAPPERTDFSMPMDLQSEREMKRAAMKARLYANRVKDPGEAYSYIQESTKTKTKTISPKTTTSPNSDDNNNNGNRSRTSSIRKGSISKTFPPKPAKPVAAPPASSRRTSTTTNNKDDDSDSDEDVIKVRIPQRKHYNI